ncbi:MAG: LemA family protein [Chloroflexi bacterium]|nr:MAG: LemA family protein [Chloroflexota bacterium]
MLWVIVLVVVLVLVGLFFLLTYNRLVRNRNRSENAWAQVDVQLKRRADLIPNLVETVKGYAAHERGTFEAVTQARANAVSAGATGDPAKIGQAENVLTQSLRSLFAVAENYPELKAIAAFTNLQEQLTATEDKIEFSRRYYNGNVRDYNTRTQTLPSSVVAGMFGFKPFAFFQADEGDREVPQVSFSSTTPPAGPPPANPAAGPPTA